MFDESEPPSPSSALVALPPLDPEWQPILQVSNQVVLYNATSHALSVRTEAGHSLARRHAGNRCPYCHRLLPTDLHHEQDAAAEIHSSYDVDEDTGGPRSRAANYFQLLEVANETASRQVTPNSTGNFSNVRSINNGGGSDIRNGSAGPSAFRADNMAEGYFKAFFQEEGRLGMGANGTVYLCQHVLDGNPLGHFAVKKIAVGQSHSYLFDILREVRLLERLHHPNVITYHHTWLETCQFSSFGPQVPTLYVLMQWAEGGSLDDFIDARLGRRAAPHPQLHAHMQDPTPSTSTLETPTSSAPQSRSERIRAFRALQRAPPAEREKLRRELGLARDSDSRRQQDWKPVHLLSAEEVRALFGDVVSGIAFLHEKSILHLDLKPGNVLLTWDEGRLIPRAMLSDFGTSQDMLKTRTRSGNTGTLEYSAPESLPSPSGVLLQVDSKSDMWSVGMILHKLLFFKLPYRHASGGSANEPKDGKENMDMLEREVQTYSGFKSSGPLVTAFESRRLPRAYLLLLESLLHVSPSSRPSSDRVLSAIREGRLDPLADGVSDQESSASSLIPVTLRRVLTPLFDGRLGVSDLHARVSQEVDPSDPTSPSIPADEKRPDGMPLWKIPFINVTVPSMHFSTNGVWSTTINVWGKQIHIRVPRVIWLRSLKSLLLVAKITSIWHVCPDKVPHPLFTTTVVGLAIMDSWFDSMTPTTVLLALHVVLVRLACWSGQCCVTDNTMNGTAGWNIY